MKMKYEVGEKGEGIAKSEKCHFHTNLNLKVNCLYQLSSLEHQERSQHSRPSFSVYEALLINFELHITIRPSIQYDNRTASPRLTPQREEYRQKHTITFPPPN